MKNQYFASVVLGLTLALHAVSGFAQRLLLATEEYPPFNMLDDKGNVIGVSTGIVRELMKSLNYKPDIDYEIVSYPWARAIMLARTQTNACVYSMSRTPERELLYKWIGPLVTNEWALFARKPAARPASLDAVQLARIGSYNGDAIVPYLQSRGFTVDISANDDANPRKLMAKRIDYWATGLLIGNHLLKRQKLTEIEPVLIFNKTEMYLACNATLPDEQFARMSQALAQLKSQGVIRKVFAEYGFHPESGYR
ncbi:MAG TPA: transporter substrate-binding domain-containing protein [Rhodocyclaceae bacterium]|nr:transporter substrate-binding domain-containing protein [Rhodocyclaceae bacterium]